MKTYFKISVVLFFTYSLLFSQEVLKRIDSINKMPHNELITNLRKSVTVLENNLKLARSNNYELGAAGALTRLGEVYLLLGKYAESTEFFFEAIKIYEENNAFEELSECYGKFGYQIKRRDPKKSEEYLQMAISYAEEYNIDKQLAALYDHYGVVKEMQNQIDSAVIFYRKSLELKEALLDSIGIPYTLNHLAGIEAMKERFDEAIRLLKRSDSYRNLEFEEYGRSENLVIWADLYYTMNLLDSAIVKYNQCISSKGAEGQPYMLYYCYEKLSNIYKQKGDFEKAYNVQIKFAMLKDSVVNFQTNAKIAELEIDYETEKKDKQIVLNESKIQEKSDQLILLSVVLVSIILIAFGAYKSQKQKSNALRKEIELTDKVNKAEIERKLSEEKLRISRELHDNIGSQLTFLVSSVDNLQFKEVDPIRIKNLEKVGEYGRETLTDLRNTIWAMKLEDTTFGELIKQITKLKQQVTNFKIVLVNNVDEQIKLSAFEILNIYRIVQEAVQNSIKHSEGKNIHISFERENEKVKISICDDGKGFNVENVEKGNGIENIKYRCESIEGKLNIESNMKGTNIICLLNK
ncbi:MAG: sensor histidine kinase [Bacteroidetes bacterium]|nr:sensor histidine kinase [Bacteroidota bacterium]